jgi:chromosome partitioning protein
MQASVIAVGNLKGGAGKTTLAVNIASALAAHGKVDLVDADAQATAQAWGEAGKLPAPVTVHALPLGAETQAGIRSWIDSLIAFKARAAFVVIDLPPNLGATTTAALTLADLFVIPVPPSGMDVRATNAAIALLRQARKVRGKDKPACLLVPSRVDRRTAAGKEIEAVLSDFREPVAPAVIQRAAHVDAFSAGQWIGDYAPRSAGHTEIEAVAAVAKRMVSR